MQSFTHRRFNRRALLAGASLGIISLCVRTPAAADPGTISVPSVSVTGEVQVTPAQVLQQDGSEQNGYLSQVVSRVGFIDETTIQDAPFSLNVAPRDLLENLGSYSGQQALSMMPATQVTVPEGRQETIVNSRGFATEVAIDGMGLFEGNYGSIPLEDKERVELLDGMDAFLNGATAARVGGLLNYVLKRPTSDPMATVTVGDAGGDSIYVHADVGGPIGNGLFGYRINAVDEGGYDQIPGQHYDRYLLSGAFDINFAPHTQLQIDASINQNNEYGEQNFYTLSGFYQPSAASAVKAGAYPNTYSLAQSTNLDAKFRSDITDYLTVRLGVARIYDLDHTLVLNQNAIAANGSYTMGTNENWSSPTVDTSYYGFIDGHFDIFGMPNQLTVGTFSHKSTYFVAEIPEPLISNFTYTGFNINNPAATATALENAFTSMNNIPYYDPDSKSPRYKSVWDSFTSYPIADKIDLTDQITLIAGGTFAHLSAVNYGVDQGATLGEITSDNHGSAFTPGATLTYRPSTDLTFYANYLQALATGGIAATTNAGLPVTNPGASGIIIDTQKEVGAKYTWNKILLTIAYFDEIKASNVYVLNSSGSSYTFSSNGLEEHNGIEIGFTGKVTDDLTLYGGGTFMNAKLTAQPATPTIVGEIPSGVSEDMAKIYAEYNIDFVPGLTLTAGVQYYGRQLTANVNPALAPGLVYIPGYGVGNVGARYEFKAFNVPLKALFNIYNVTDNKYWMTPNYAGSPLTAVFSVKANLY